MKAFIFLLQILWHFMIFAVLTILTQIGGIAWLVALFFKRRIIAFLGIYFVSSLGAIFLAPHFGRQALPCFSNENLVVASPLYCVLNRTYVTPEMAGVAGDLAERMATEFPGTQTRVLDASFPFWDGFPLIPHLSHDDGEKLDIAFYYQNDQMASPIGYWGFEDGPTQCPDVWPTLRWDMAWLAPFMRDTVFDETRTRAALLQLSQDPRVSKILLEPHLETRLGVRSNKIRFQGCRAARHDDHIHFQL
ncbi:hypothetical protein [Parasulfitobacter algicola]|uniref:Uncharacterized protein n=1 Tax=Parasulfitobacter algicola TaxID=2614809 RepID=A0ABX2IW52_9RHOB|nr:hypothetical protein [Sulfitobacter algicola]NSX55087.1 hypothetical protein [Sulfitobacter algicola]